MNPKNGRFTFPTAVLESESAEGFAALLEDLNQDIQPRSVMERMYVYDVANMTWDILRYRRAKAAILNSAMRGSPILQKRDPFLQPLSFGRTEDDREEPSEEQRNESVEALAFREDLGHIEKLDRLIASAESRRDKALRNLALHEQSFAKRLQSGTDRLLDTIPAPTIAPSDQEAD
jgi:hypothetical protein